MKILRLGQKQCISREMDLQLAGSMVMGTIMQTIFYLKNGRITVNYNAVIDEVCETC
ncbi:MAG: hypothetical protein O7G31_01470 [Calditrichaeota bacterium]|nr:hypothetical protein [Calditrichota bacterium]